MSARPPCPYCGEHQARDEARPSKPYVDTDYALRRGRFVRIKKTYWNTECRTCGKLIVWGCLVGTFNERGFVNAPCDDRRFSWGKPLAERR